MEAFHFKGYLKPKILPYRKLLQSFLFSYQVAIMQLKSLFDLLKINRDEWISEFYMRSTYVDMCLNLFETYRDI